MEFRNWLLNCFFNGAVYLFKALKLMSSMWSSVHLIHINCLWSDQFFLYVYCECLHYGVDVLQWLARELALLKNLIDRANEKGWRREYPFSISIDYVVSFSAFLILDLPYNFFF